MIHLGNAKFMGEDVLIFVHIPKTAGTTLMRVIERQFPPSQTYFMNLYLMNDDRQKSIEHLKIHTQVEKAQIRCLKGHMPFGLHQFLPRMSRYVTVLRDPIERMISSYYFVLSLDKNDPLYSIYFKKSLEEFVTFMYTRNELNLQTRYIGGGIEFENLRPPYPPLGQDAITIAKRHLATEFQLVGLTERFDETLILMKQLFGFRNVFYAKRNVTRMRPSEKRNT